MTRLFLTAGVLSWSIVVSFLGCISSEETGAGDRAKSPVQVFGPVDTTSYAGRQSMRQDSLLNSRNKFNPIAGRLSRTASKFKSKQDTVHASVIKKSKTSVRPQFKIERPEHPLYTVQIGAFSQASYALRTQKKAKQRFAHQSIYNRYNKSAKMYRVSIGRYKDRKNAFAFADTIKQSYPKEYKQCWINFIQ